jgi:hypothetical protein
MDGQGTSSSPSTERVCRGGDEAAEVQGEHKVNVDHIGEMGMATVQMGEHSC